jgi:hypothetical protein
MHLQDEEDSEKVEVPEERIVDMTFITQGGQERMALETILSNQKIYALQDPHKMMVSHMFHDIITTTSYH